MRPLPTVDCSQPSSCIIFPYIYFYLIVEHMDRIIIASELDASTNRILDWVGGGDYREAVSLYHKKVSFSLSSFVKIAFMSSIIAKAYCQVTFNY